ncbi:MAG: hypothetical protein ACOX4O_10100 [Eubacteriales bacterium]|jgi:hypothetical protein
MSEFVYGLNQRTGPRPIIRKIGAIAPDGMEQTPVIFKGAAYSVESAFANEYCPVQHLHVRNIETGELSPPFGANYYFASAFVEGDTLYAFATSQRDDRPMTMYQSEDSASWHDPRGGHTVRMFTTTDLINWEERDIIHCPDRRLWNTSVCKGRDGYVMAIEVSHQEGYDIPQIGVPFTIFFAESKDLYNWKMMPDDCSYTKHRYNACPALRYYDGWYYMVCLEALPCVRYAPYIYRTRNFLDWEVGFHNPMMMWGDEDRIPKPGVEFSEKDLDTLQNGLNINCSDLDFFEYKGKTHIFYANGNQMTYSFLCEAVYDGTEKDFVESFFR